MDGTGVGSTARAPAPAAIAGAGLVALAIAIGIGRFAFTPILPMMQAEGLVAVREGAWLAAANYLGYLVGALSAAAVPVPATVGIRAGLLGIGLATVGMGTPAGFGPAFGLRALAGIASAWVLVFAAAWCLGGLAAAGRPALGGVVFAGVGVGIAVAGGVCLALMAVGAGSAAAWRGLGGLALAGALALWRTLAGGETARGAGARAPAGPGPGAAEAARLVLCYGAFGFGYIIPATFVPVLARQLVRDPLVFGWAWPLFGVAAAVSTLVGAAGAHRLGRRRQWALGHGVMALGVAAPVWWPSLGGVLAAALLVGGTFMVVTMAGMEEARAVGGPRATRLMAVMTAAFAAGQLAGPLVVGAAPGGFAGPLLAASALLLVAGVALARPRPGAGPGAAAS